MSPEPGLTSGHLVVPEASHAESSQSTSTRAQARAWKTKAWLEANGLQSSSGSGVAFVSDERMLLHAGPEKHPERPARLAEILKQLEMSGLEAACERVNSREATREELLRVHTEQHIEQVFTSGSSKKKGKSWGMPFGPDTYANDQTPLCASLSAGCLLALVDHCMASTDSTDSNCNCGFAAIRPPGHHASEEKACGFCMFNNVAVAARHAQKEHGLNNIAILDWDVHHGNGTNDIFAKDKSVFFCSLHRYDDHFFPGTGFVEDVGKDQARGFNVNIPLEKGFGDLDLVHVMKHLICPLMDNFKPDAIFISAGFDAVRGDRLGECKVSPEGFGWMTRSLYRLAKHYCEGRLFLALEGGYEPDLIAQCTVECVRTLLAEVNGFPGPDVEDFVPATPMSSLPATPAMGPSPASPSGQSGLFSRLFSRSEGGSRPSTPSLRPDGTPPASPAMSASSRKVRGPAGKTLRSVRKATELLQPLPMQVQLAPQGEGASKNAKRNERRRQRKHSEEDGASDSSGWTIACGGDPEFPYSPAMRIATRQVSSSSHASHEVPDLELPPPVEEIKEDTKDTKNPKETEKDEMDEKNEKEKTEHSKHKQKKKSKRK